MNYEKIIVELLSRIQTLEEQVATLISNQESNEQTEESQMSTQEIREYIERLKEIAKSEGKTSIVLRSGDIHKDLNLKNYMPPVCNAMRQCMGPFDTVIHTTPSGNSSTIQIEYVL